MEIEEDLRYKLEKAIKAKKKFFKRKYRDEGNEAIIRMLDFLIIHALRGNHFGLLDLKEQLEKDC